MQLMIDINAETPEQIDIAVQFLVQHAALKRAMLAQFEDVVVSPMPAAQAAPVHSPPTIEIPAPPAPPAPSNVLPFVPPVSAPIATTPAVPSVPSATSATAAVAPPAPTTGGPSNVYSIPTRNPNTPLELDKAGIPWDERIHQKTKNKKKDGTWKIQKNIDAGLLAAVVQELHALMINSTPDAPPAAPNPAAIFGKTPLPAGAVAPVALPPGQAQGQAAPQTPAAPFPPQGQAAPQAPAAPQTSVIPPATAAVPMPPANGVGMPNAGQPGVVQRGFRELVKKITDAKIKGLLSDEQIKHALAQAGVPSMQLLGAMPQCVPDVETFIDNALLGM